MVLLSWWLGKGITFREIHSFWDTIIDKLEDDAGVEVIYTDFSKAFDKVETVVLLNKVKEYGVTGRVGCWLAAFRDPISRQLAVVIDGIVSSHSQVISGVPQGSFLTLLFTNNDRDKS